MNHPDGNCPLCLYPLVPKDENDEVLPFMKLMSCFHCFHGWSCHLSISLFDSKQHFSLLNFMFYCSECIVHWWNWLQKEKEDNASCGDTLHPIRVMRNERGIFGAQLTA